MTRGHLRRPFLEPCPRGAFLPFIRMAQRHVAGTRTVVTPTVRCRGTGARVQSRVWPRPRLRVRPGGAALRAVVAALVAGVCLSVPTVAAAQEPQPDALTSTDTAAEAASLAEYRELCEQPKEGNDVVDSTRRILAESSCAAVLWFDGLLGSGAGDLASARRTSGEVDLAIRLSEFHGAEPDAGVRLRYDLPNLQRRVNVFLGRGDGGDAVRDRERRGVARPAPGMRAEEDRWIAGLGFLPVERWRDAADVRVGVRPATSPVLFAQARFEQHLSPGLWGEVRVRQTVFWENRAGFGVTGSSNYRHLLDTKHLFDWEAIGTVSQASEGVEWRSEATVWRRLGGLRSMGLQPFALGATSADVPLEEFGVRGRYRRPLGNGALRGELVVGYSWPRSDRAAPREGSALAGVGLELVFGPSPP
jgi:hypothetical protein